MNTRRALLFLLALALAIPAAADVRTVSYTTGVASPAFTGTATAEAITASGTVAANAVTSTTTVTATTNVSGAGYRTATVCTSSGGTCAAAAAGRVTIAAAATTVTVATTAVTASSQIFVQEDSTMGTALGVTCNTTTGRDYTVTTRTAATSFVITASAAPVTNPACLSFFVLN